MVRGCCIAFALLVMGRGAMAQTYGEIEQMLERKEYAKGEGILIQRVQARPDDDSAHFYLGQLPFLIPGSKDYDGAIGHFKRCVQLRPDRSEYHHWLGRAYGVKAQRAGLLKAMGYVGDIKSSFKKAVELDPANFDARFDLVQFYLMAPGIAGGGVSKAREAARDHERINAGEAKLLLVLIELKQKQFDAAAAALRSMTAPSDPERLLVYRNCRLQTGFSYLEDKQPAKAQSLFAEYLSQYPEDARACHGLGRSLFDLAQYDEAIPRFERAIELDSVIGSQYRLGLIYEQKGDTARAIQYLDEYLALEKGRNDKTVKKARDRLAALKGKRT